MSSDSQGPRFSFPGNLGWDCLGPLLLSLVSRAEQSLFSFCVSVDAGLGAGLGEAGFSPASRPHPNYAMEEIYKDSGQVSPLCFRISSSLTITLKISKPKPHSITTNNKQWAKPPWQTLPEPRSLSFHPAKPNTGELIGPLGLSKQTRGFVPKSCVQEASLFSPQIAFNLCKEPHQKLKKKTYIHSPKGKQRLHF